MNVGRIAGTLIARAGGPMLMPGIVEARSRNEAAQAALAAAQQAYDDALAFAELGEGGIGDVEVAASKAKLDAATAQAARAFQALRVVDARQAAEATKAAAADEAKAWAEAKKLSDRRAALIRDLVAQCERLEKLGAELAHVNQRLDLVSPRRRASPDLRDTIVGIPQRNRLAEIVEALTPSLQAEKLQRGVSRSKHGVAGLIQGELDRCRQFGDRNFSEE